MNCIPGLGISGSPMGPVCHALAGHLLLGLAAIAVSVCNTPALASTEPPPKSARSYRIDYVLTPQPMAGGTRVEMRLTQSRRFLRVFDMQAGRIDLSSVEGNGEVQIDDGRVLWEPPADGGTLSWFAPIDHLRSGDQHDAHINFNWAVFRAEDVMPAARTRTLIGAVSETKLSFKLPSGWSSVTQYFGSNNSYAVKNPGRRFDRPTGWILLGKIGRRNEDIAGVRVVVAGPVGQSIRRMDTLALLQWTLPDLVNLLPEFPRRVTVISAGTPMWRGGLSAPASIFLHADRPLLSENATSTLLHEIMHVGLGLSAGTSGDWIVEGLAEYYGLELLRRSGTISARRHASALEDLRDWSKDSDKLCQNPASGPVTARAVTILHALDQNIRQNSEFSLDDLVRRLVTDDNDITVATLQSVAKELTGTTPRVIADGNLPGCSG